MIAYPETDHEFDEAFRTEENRMEYLISVRWTDGPRCPVCHHDRLWRTSQRHVLGCSACGHKMRPLSGTIFQDSHISARL
jgi:Zn ribbon nucleic-acid-binding protein